MNLYPEPPVYKACALPLYCNRGPCHDEDLLDDAEEVDVGVVDGEVGDDQASAAIDPKKLLKIAKALENIVSEIPAYL